VPPQQPPMAAVAPTGPPATAFGPDVAKKICPRCHTAVRAIDVSCFFCGYKFPEGGSPPP